MNQLEAIIIDDEKHARESLSTLLELYCPQVKVLAEAATIQEGIQTIQRLNPTIVFLDIAIGEDTGFDLLNKLQPIDFKLIFATAFNNYALKAFKENAIDYLLKPINPQELIRAIKKVQEAYPANQGPPFLQTAATKPTSKIAIHSIEGITFLKTSQIIHVNGNGNYSTFFSIEGDKIIASKNLKHFELLLPKDDFFRSHQSHLVNLHFIKKVLSQDSMIKLSNGTLVPITRNRKEQLIKIMCNLL